MGAIQQVPHTSPHLQRNTPSTRCGAKHHGSGDVPSHGVLAAEQIIKGIERRLSYVTFLPVENGEGLQILRYEVRVGQ